MRSWIPAFMLLAAPAWAIQTPDAPLEDVQVGNNFSVSGTSLMLDVLTVSVTTGGVMAEFDASNNNANSILVSNSSIGTGARAEFDASNGTSNISYGIGGPSLTISGIFNPNHGYIRCSVACDGLDIGTGGSSPLGLWTNSSQRLVITDVGLVGINTPTPTAPLEVTGGISATSGVLTSNTSGASILIINGNSNGTSNVSLTNTSTGTGAQASYLVGNGNASGALAMPGVSFTTSGMIEANAFTIRAGVSASALNAGTGGSGKFGLFTNSSERILIAADGKVGVNTATPTTTFEVNGNVSASSVVTSGTTATCTSAADFGKARYFATYSTWGVCMAPQVWQLFQTSTTTVSSTAQ